MRFRVYRVAFLIGLGCTSRCVAAPLPPSLSGNWNLLLDQEFNSLPSPNTWVTTLFGTTTLSGLDNIYDASAMSASNGVLSITARRQSLSGYNYVSGVLDTGPNVNQLASRFSFTYGYVEARMKIPAGQGLWSAFWMLPDPGALGGYSYAPNEIDIMEAIGSQPTIDQVHYHLGPSAYWGTGVNANVDLSQAFHTYAVNWEPGEIDWYLDGTKIYSLSQSPSTAEYLIMNLAVGAPGTWPGAPDGSTVFPSSLQVQTVQVWQERAVPEPMSAWLGTGLLIATLRPRGHRTAA